MYSRRHLSLLVVVLWLAPICAAFSQSDRSPLQSHVPIQNGVSPLSAGAAAEHLDLSLEHMQFAARTKQKAVQDFTAQLLKNPATLMQLQNQLKRSKPGEKNDLLEKLRAIQKEADPKQAPMKFTQKEAEALLPLLRILEAQQQVPRMPANDDQMLKAIQQPFKSADDDAVAKGSDGSTSPMKPNRPRKPSEARPDSRSQQPSPESAFQKQIARDLANYAEKFASGTALTRSPSWQRMMQGLDRYRRGDNPNTTGEADSLFGRLGIETNLGKIVSLENWSITPALPRTSLPQLSSLIATPGGSGSGARPQAAFSGVSSADLGRILFWAVFVGGGGVLFWWLLSGKNPFAKALPEKGNAAAWSVGPWPVPPTQVQTHEQLIQAFEHLSLLLLGKDARNWNHCEIANSLSSNEVPPARRHAARELTALYENARYAPEARTMPEEDLASARQHLCFLAGVSA